MLRRVNPSRPTGVFGPDASATRAGLSRVPGTRGSSAPKWSGRAGAATAYVDESVADVVETMEVIRAQFAQQGVAL